MLREEVIAFLHSYAAGEYDAGELVRFRDWLNTAPLQEIEECIELYKTIAENREPEGGVGADIIMQIEQALNGVAARQQQPGTRTRFFAIVGRWLLAATLVGGLSVGGYRLLFQQQRTKPVIAPAAMMLNDVPAPKNTKATLTLGDGRVVELQDKEEGVLTRQGGVEIIREGHEGLVYKQVSTETPADASVSYNLLHNPKGSSVVALTLSDGTRAWLNAESSLRYPVNFGEERQVEITGEAYFEVARDPRRKFIVDAGGVRTEVLGTHFNVNAYKDEDQTVVTLLEGAVRVDMDNVVPVMLQPGEQALATTGIRVSKNVDTRAVVAWKEGMLVMRQTDIGSVMRQIGRWYNVEVKYVAGVPKGTVSGEVSRELNLSEILKVLEYSDIQVKIEDGKAIVMP